MSKRQVFRYTVPVDDRPHTFDLTNDPLHVANGNTLDEVEFWAEHDADTLEYPAVFQVFGTGQPLPDGEITCATCLKEATHPDRRPPLLAAKEGD